jgi:hypothetical protein
MAVKFHYPSGRRGDDESVEDFAISDADKTENSEETLNPEKNELNKQAMNESNSQPSLEQLVPQPKPEKKEPEKLNKEGFIRLINFVKAHVKEKNDPEKTKKEKAIMAYQKMKKAA